jgi:hypothetical protein
MFCCIGGTFEAQIFEAPKPQSSEEAPFQEVHHFGVQSECCVVLEKPMKIEFSDP